jgi:hypothetical protein
VQTLKNIQSYLLASLVVILLFSCEGGEKSDNSATMTTARGESGEIILVMTPDQWESPLGSLVRDVFTESVEAIPQDEPLYNLRRTDPSNFNSVLKAAKNLIFVASLDDKSSEGKQLTKYFTEGSIERIKENPELFSFTQSDVYAKGQEVLYLFGRTPEELINNIQANRERVQELFNGIEEDRLVSNLKKSTSKGIMSYLSDSMGIDIVIPFGYDIAVKGKNFTWIRKLDQKEEINFWVAKMPFTDEAVFDPSNIKNIRNQLSEMYITDLDNDSLHLTTQDELELVIDTVNLNGNYALRTKGLWKYSDNSRGGAFIGYLFADEKDGELYYLEGYLDNPGEDKREPMRLIKAILGTADIPKTIND